MNSRNWKSFGSRNTNELNKPIIYLTVNSIIENCDKSFNICVIDDNSFNNLIPGWNIDLETVPEPNKAYYRSLAFLHLIYLYGGMIVPSSFLCFKNLVTLYEEYTSNNKFFITECYPKSIMSDHVTSFPCMNIIGSNKNNERIKKLLLNLETHFLRSLTDENNFKGTISSYLSEYLNDDFGKLVSGKLFGYFDNNGNPITQNELMSDESIVLDDNLYGIEIPIDDIINRTSHNWIATIPLDDLPLPGIRRPASVVPR